MRARLMDFEFRHRARTWRLVAEAIGLDAEALAKCTALGDDETILAWVAEQMERPESDLREVYGRCAAEARAALIKERGDPTLHRRVQSRSTATLARSITGAAGRDREQITESLAHRSTSRIHSSATPALLRRTPR